MSLSRSFGGLDLNREKGTRSHSAQGLPSNVTSTAMNIPLPPRMWITDVENDSSDEVSGSQRDEGVVLERPRVRSRFRHHKARTGNSVPIGIFWDIENCQVPRGCSPIDIVSAIRAKFLPGRREADFVVVCDVRKEAAFVLQELNDAQVSLIHVCGTQKNAADEKLRQCMRRFAELHTAPAALLLISGDINFASDLSDFRHRKNMEVILMHKQNTSSALIACASSHYCYNQLTANLPRNPKTLSFCRSNDDDEDPQCELEVSNIPMEQSVENVCRRLRRLADNCGGKVLKVYNGKALLKFPTPDHALRALKRMDGEDVYGRKIMTRYARSSVPPAPAYSSDEGYSTAPPPTPARHNLQLHHQVNQIQPMEENKVTNDWALALQHLPAPTPPPLEYCPPPAPKLRKIRGTHGSVNLDRSGCSSSNSGDDGRPRAASPWNSSSFSEQSDTDGDSTTELTIGNLPPYEPLVLQEMLTKLFNQYIPVVRVSVWLASDGPLATVVLRSEWDARVAIARVHKRRLDNQWTGRRLELSLGRPSPAPNLDILRARLRAILLDQKNHVLPLVRLRDAYASRHCCALTTSDICKVKDTVMIHENYGRMVQLIDLSPVSSSEMEEAPWKCHIHASLSTGQEDGSRILQPVFMEVDVLAKNVHMLLENHGGILPLLSFVECYEATFQPLYPDPQHGVALELLLRSANGFEVKDTPSRHLTWRNESNDSPSNCSQSESSRSSGEREKPRTAPALEPMLALFERELIDLLRTEPKCTISFSKLIPAFHHHFGRQCRVADYGFTKLPDLLAALSNSILVLGSGSSRVITISAFAQGRRWTSDLLKMLKTQPGRTITVNNIPQLYHGMFARPFNPVDYGVCTLRELLQRVNPQAVTISPDGNISLPRCEPTPTERARTLQFAVEIVELLIHTPNLRMEFSRFVPAYNSHFERQLRVALYGCVKLVDLFEMIPDVVSVCAEVNGERAVKLAPQRARSAVGKRLSILAPLPVGALSMQYARQYGAPPQPDMLDVKTLEELVYAAGGCIDNEVVIPPVSAWRWTNAKLSACAALCGDRSVARGSTHEYFTATYRRHSSTLPDMEKLKFSGVIRTEDSRVMLTPLWRIVFRISQILCENTTPAMASHIFLEYTKRYEPIFPGTDAGLNGFCEYIRQFPEVFADAGGGRYMLNLGIVVPRPRDVPAVVHEDYSVHDTPPGQKGSRVFDSPKHNIWCSPPASALPTPTALLTHEKRRTRLAAQFDAS